MKGYYMAGGWLLFVAAVICGFAAFDRLKRRAAREDARYAAQRTEGMGDLASEPTPIHDALAAEAVIASAGEVVAAEWARAEVYDVDDDWPGAS